NVLTKMKELLQEIKPSLVLVQGDTTSAMSAALASFYLKIPVGHIEAGLRTGNKYAPYPEEMNRCMISLISSYHFAPTKQAAQNLVDEHISPQRIFCVGNTVVDALYTIRNKINDNQLSPSRELQEVITNCKAKKQKLMLLTAHRRESFD